MGSHNEVAFDRLNEECVLHGPCGVILVEVERVEVEPLVFEFGPFGYLPAHSHENVRHFLHEEVERVACTDGSA